MKKCIDCDIEKELSEFNKRKASRDGKQPRCRSCEKERWLKDVTNDADKRRQYRGAQKDRDDRNIAAYLIRIAKKRAKAKDLPCTLRVSDLTIPTHCPITGVEMRRYRGKLDGNSFSIDQITPGLGYIPGNVRVISWKANNAKYNLSLEEIENLLLYCRGYL